MRVDFLPNDCHCYVPSVTGFYCHWVFTGFFVPQKLVRDDRGNRLVFTAKRPGEIVGSPLVVF
jgi:hypothetical protein